MILSRKDGLGKGRVVRQPDAEAAESCWNTRIEARLQQEQSPTRWVLPPTAPRSRRLPSMVPTPWTAQRAPLTGLTRHLPRTRHAPGLGFPP